jgi:peptide/nickel transport system substrate-binding protein
VEVQMSGSLRFRRRWVVGLAGLAALGLALVPATIGASAATKPSKITFTVGITQDIDSLNPFTGIVSSAYEIYQINYDTLTNYSQKDFSPTPGLAKSWDTSADGLTWTYHIRSGVKWSDGVPLTANDVAYTFNRIINGKYEQTNYGNYVANIKSVVATDDHTVVMKVDKPTPIMLHLYIYILPEHIWKSIDEKKVHSYSNEPGPQGIVGSGPFQVTDYRKGQFIKLEANKSYWAGAPHVDELVFRVFSNEDALAQALKSGDIDFADSLGANAYNSMKNTPGITTVPAQYSGFDEIAMNYGAALDNGTPIGDGHPALKDQRVRVAVAHAIDQKVLVQRVLQGYGSEGTSIIPPLYRSLHYDPGTSRYKFDLAEANRELDAAGYKKGSDGIRRMPGNGRPLDFRLFGRSDSATSKKTVQYVTGWLKDIGIDVKPKIVSEDALTEIIGKGTFDMFEWGWVVEPDPNYQLSTFTCANRSYKDGGNIYANLSDSFYCNKTYDTLFQKQTHQIDEAQRAQTVKQMEKMLYVAAPYVLTYYYDDLEAYRSDRFTGFKPQPDPGGSLLFQYGSYSYQHIHPPSKHKASSDNGSNTGLITTLSIAGAVVVLGGAFIAVRSRRSQDDVE